MIKALGAVVIVGLAAAPVLADTGPQKANVAGAGFAWRLDDHKVEILRKGHHAQVVPVEGKCAFDNMFDAPERSVPGMLTPLVHCQAEKQATFLVAFKAKGRFDVRRYTAEADCADFSVCKQSKKVGMVLKGPR